MPPRHKGDGVFSMLGDVFWPIPEPAGGLLSRLAAPGAGTAQSFIYVCVYLCPA